MLNLECRRMHCKEKLKKQTFNVDRQLHRDEGSGSKERESKAEHRHRITQVILCSLRKLETDKITEKNGVSCDPKRRKKKWDLESK